MNTDEHSHDSPAFVRTAVERHQAPLLRYAARILHGDADRAQDVVQDTFIRLLAQPPAAVDGHLAEWLFTVCRHRALDVLRKEGRMSALAEGQAERLTAADPRPGTGLERAEAHAAVASAVAVATTLLPVQRSWPRAVSVSMISQQTSGAV